jgi:hypothetical protein
VHPKCWPARCRFGFARISDDFRALGIWGPTDLWSKLLIILQAVLVHPQMTAIYHPCIRHS